MKNLLWFFGLFFIISACQIQSDPITHQVTFIDDQGDILHVKTVIDGQPLGELALAMEKTGYNLYWMDQEDIIYNEQTIIHQDLNLISVYELMTWTITFEMNGGTIVQPMTVGYGQTVYLDSIKSTKEGSYFCGWSFDEDNNEPVQSFIMQESDVTLYAHWCLNFYRLNYHLTDGFTSIRYFTQDQEISPWIPMYKSYVFNGWYEQDSDDPFDFSNMPARNVDVYEQKIDKTYTFHWETNNDLVIEPTSFKLSEQNIDLHLDLVYNEQTLYGWFYDPLFQKPYNGLRPGNTSEITLYALWNPVGLTMYKLPLENAYIAFAYDEVALEEITIPETFGGMNVIGVGGFKNSSYRKVYLPKTIQSISSLSFSNMQNLTEVIFADDSELESIGSSAFYESSLSDINLPNSLQSIGHGAFGRTKIKGLWIPQSVIEINTPFSNAQATLYFESSTLPSSYTNSYQNPTHFDFLGTCRDDTFLYMLNSDHAVLVSLLDSSSTEIFIPKSVCGYPVKSIGPYAMHFSKIRQVTLQEESQLESIGDHAFDQSYYLNQFIFPESLKHIGAYAFYRTNLTQIHIPSSVETIGVVAFADIYAPAITITFGDQSKLKVIDISTFNGIRGTIDEIIIPKSVETIKVNAFNSTKITTLTFEEGSNLKTIESGAFKSASNLVTLILPDGLETIGEEAFQFNTSLVYVYIPKSILIIEAYAFRATSIPIIEIDLAGPLPGFHMYWVNSTQTVTYLGSA